MKAVHGFPGTCHTSASGYRAAHGRARVHAGVGLIRDHAFEFDLRVRLWFFDDPFLASAPELDPVPERPAKTL